MLPYNTVYIKESSATPIDKLHGSYVLAAAAGKVLGVAKKATIFMTQRSFSREKNNPNAQMLHEANCEGYMNVLQHVLSTGRQGKCVVSSSEFWTARGGGIDITDAWLHDTPEGFHFQQRMSKYHYHRSLDEASGN